jgi:hypothetical protein
MTRRIPGGARIGAALALTGVLSLIAIMPAAAASPNEAYSSAATGSISASPIGLATFPGTDMVILANANIAGLLTTGVTTNEVDATDASSTIASISAALTSLVMLSATSISSACTFDTNTDAVSGSTNIASGQITTPTSTIVLASSPAPNTIVSGLSAIGTVTLNAQSTATDGTLTVTAVQVSLLGSGQTLSLGVTVCNAADLAPVPLLPGKTATVAFGAAGVLALAGGGLQLRRRSSSGGQPHR